MAVIKKIPKIAILMCTYNGEQFLNEQLDSIQNQNYKNWTLYVNDDGSKDKTLNILKAYQKKWASGLNWVRADCKNRTAENIGIFINNDFSLNSNPVKFSPLTVGYGGMNMVCGIESDRSGMIYGFAGTRATLDSPIFGVGLIY